MYIYVYIYNFRNFFNSERLFGNSPTIKLFDISLFKKILFNKIKK